MSGQGGVSIRGGDINIGSGISIKGGQVGPIKGGDINFSPLLIIAFVMIPLVFFGAIFYLFVSPDLWFICLPFVLVGIVVIIIAVAIFALQRKKYQGQPVPPPPPPMYPPPQPPPPPPPTPTPHPPPPPHMPHEPLSYAPSSKPKERPTRCSVCGKRFTPEATFCSNCGTKR
jgi:hypothetical protein